MNNIDYDELVEPIVNIYRNIETRLLIKIASAFKQYEEVNLGNSLEWYLQKIEELGGLNAEAVDIISKYSNIPKKEVIDMLKKAGYNIDLDLIHKANDNGILSIDVDKLLKSKRVNDIINNSYNELNKTFRMIKTKSVSAFNDSYMNVLNEAYTSVSTGAYDYNTAISNALKDLTNKVIKVASYKQTNGSIRNYSIESTVRRDVITAVVQNGIRSQLEIAKEMGAECVETSEHMGARDTGTLDYKDHSWWQGKVYKLEGSSSKYPNFQECCNFGDIQVIGGANCRHSIRPFIPGVSIERPSEVDKEENKKQYELSQQQRAYERKIREIKRNIEVGKASNDKNKVKKYKGKFEEINKEYNDFCSKNNLKRHYDRERVLEQYTKSDSKVDDIKNKLPYEDLTKTINENASPILEIDRTMDFSYDSEMNKYDNCFYEEMEQWKIEEEKKYRKILESKLNCEVFRNPKPYEKNKKSPDYYVSGLHELWDVKGIDGNSNNIIENILGKACKRKQTPFLIIHKRKTTKETDSLKEELISLFKVGKKDYVKKVMLFDENDELILYLTRQ